MDMSKKDWIAFVIFVGIVVSIVKYSVEWQLKQPVCNHTFGEWFVETDAFQSKSMRMCNKCGKLDQ